MHALLGENVVRQRLGDRKDPDFCALFTDINLASQPLIGSFAAHHD
jgi:hypothetical protein